MNALVVFVKAPVPGAVKTRLWPPVAPARAAALYRAFAQDTIDQAGRVSGAEVLVAYEGSARFPDLSWLSAAPDFFPQTAATLGERLERAVGLCLRSHPKVVVIGSDAPHVQASSYEQAFEALDRVDVALGPTQDGGYYLIGLKRPEPGLFRDIPWSTGEVLRATLRRTRELGLTSRLLREEFDVDSFGDLKQLARLVMRGQAHSPCTEAVLAAMLDQDLSHAPFP